MPPEPVGHRGEEAVASDVYEAVLRNLPDTTVFVFGPDLRYRLVEGGGFRQAGWSRDDLIGLGPRDLLPDQVSAAKLEDAMRAALAGRTSRHETPGLRQKDVHWENIISPLTSTDGEIIGGLVVSRNLGRLRQAEADRSRSQLDAARWSEAAQVERRLRERLEFLAGIEEVLGACRDRREIMRAVVTAAVPRLGDWCSIHVFMDPRDVIPAAEVGHVDPEMVQLATRFVESIPYDPDAEFGIPRVVRTGEPALLQNIDPAAIEAFAGGEGSADVVSRLGLKSSLVVPLGVQGEIFGALTFSVSGNDRVLDEDDVALASALAGRVAASLDIRRLAEVERRIASTLQKSLLPDVLPRIPAADLAVRYWAAGEGTAVGGDFYDVFDTGFGSHAVVIGDVCGSGPAAAAVTSTVRHTVRALARRGDDHGTIMRQLNDAVLSSWPDVFCTVAYATITTSERGLHMVALSGGHPLPIVVRSEGTVSTAGQPGMLIGALPIPDQEPFELDLEPGDTVVFYTDGAFDLPPPQYLSEEDLLTLVAEGASEQTADEVADAIAGGLEAIAPFEDRDDDVALVVVRVTTPRDPA